MSYLPDLSDVATDDAEAVQPLLSSATWPSTSA